jgi:hypothetical protein
MSVSRSRPSALSDKDGRTICQALLALLLLLSVASAQGWAQEEKRDTSGVTAVPAGRLTAPQIKADTAAYHPTKSPGKAMLFSALLPGSGQFYNESYWKVPIVVGFGVYFAYNWIDNNRLYKQYRDQYKQSLVTDASGNDYILKYREFYKDQRDSFTWYLLIWYFITLADAYVDASLYDFNVGSNLSLQTLPVLSPVPVRAFQLNLHVGF